MEEVDVRGDERTAQDMNVLSGYLAQRDFTALTPEAVSAVLGGRADLLILMGGSIASGCELAASAFLSGDAERLMIAGGAGHTTQALRDTVHQRYPDVETEGRAEAQLIAEMFEKHYSLPRSRVILEDRSRNCGENAVFALEVAKAHGLTPRTVILMQDSSMQRRMDLSFRKAWAGTGARFFGYAAHVPEVISENGELRYAGAQPWGMWPLMRFLTLILGEIPRLRDDADGYGPRGKNFIAHADIPEAVLLAFDRLALNFPHLVRPAWKA
jgi:uncharacterized SAM-binding protein YcdF (DUF218 family)